VSVAILIATSAIVAVGAALQGAVGFGFGLFSVPLLLLIAPSLVPGPILASSTVLTLLLTHLHRRGINRRHLAWALSGRVVGIGCAVVLLAVASSTALALWSGVLVLVAVLLSASGLRVAPAPRTLVVAGVLSGIMATVVSTGGPPMALLYQREPGPQLRGTLAAYFLVGVTLSLIGLHLTGHFGWPGLRAAAALVPGVLVGYAISRKLARVLDRGYTRPAVLAISGLSSIVVIIRAVKGG
jgi:uncharacterized membrane protein YfcA